MTGDAGAAGGALGLVSSETTSTLEASSVVAHLDYERRRFGRLRRVILTAGRLMVDTFAGRQRWWMVTLTYKPSVEWAPGQIRSATDAMRAWLKRRGLPCRYVWVLEATKAGRPHYHLLVQVPQLVTLPHFDTQGWWPHGFTETKRARRAVGYLAKYASKAGGGITWRGARCYGVSGLSAHHRAVLSFWRAPRWVRTACGFADAAGTVSESEVVDPVRRVRGGFVWRQTGELFRSPFVARFVGGVLCFFRRDVELAPSL